MRVARVEELSSVEASLRLDAVASAGFRMSRSKMADLVKAGALPLCCAVLWGAVEPRAWFSRDAGGVGVQPWVGVVGACVRRGDLRHATKARARPCTPALQAMCASTGGRGGRAAAKVAAGDVVSCAGKGRLEVKEVTRTAKGKYSIKMVAVPVVSTPLDSKGRGGARSVRATARHVWVM